MRKIKKPKQKGVKRSQKEKEKGTMLDDRITVPLAKLFDVSKKTMRGWTKKILKKNP